MNINDKGLQFEGFLSKEEFIEMQQKKLESGKLSDSFCCIYFYIKNFRSFYMVHGFENGLKVLVSTAEIIRKVFDKEDTGHLGDNRYAVIYAGRNAEEQIKKVRKSFDDKWKYSGMKIIAGVSFKGDSGEDTITSLIENARIASFMGEDDEDGYFELGSGRLVKDAIISNYVIDNLENAIKNDYIDVYYQPIVHSLSQKTCGFEALARWNDPKYGKIMPSNIISSLERAGKIHILDSHIIELVCKDLCGLPKGMDPVPISINFRRMDFVLADMLDVVIRNTDKYGIDRELIQIEISESEIKIDKDVIKRQLLRFHEEGFKIAFDDFGSEYSSLHILNELPFDAIKINSSFLSGLTNGDKSRVMMKNVINMAKELHLGTMMGSVENEEILDYLIQIGCEKTQGHLYSEALPCEELHKVDYYPENKEERQYFDDISRINILSQTPLEIEEAFETDRVSVIHTLPISIFELEDGRIRVFMTTKSFDEIISPMYVDGKTSVEAVFNDNKAVFSRHLRKLSEQCAQSSEIHTMEFVTSAGFHRIMLKKVSSYKNKTAIISLIESYKENDPGKKAVKLNSTLRFLYMMYNRVDIVMTEKNTFETVFENLSNYAVKLKGNTYTEAILKFSEEAIYNEDREKFLNFYDVTTLDERLSEFNADHLTDYFRTKDVNGEYDWLMYLIIPVISEGHNMFIMCSRGIDSERMRKLPEISQSGSVYYDMPSDPTFLLLASDAFTDTLGYGSFEQFIRNSFYLEANLSENKTVYMHLGQSGLISDFGETGYIELPFNEVTKSMVFSQVVEEDRDKMYEFYDRDRLIEGYKKGKISGNIVFLERVGANDTGRYQNACYQIRRSREDDSLRIYILTYDVDEFKRTNEKIKNLAERDTLTGLYNRTTIGNIFLDEIGDLETRSLAVVILDLDYFKQVNDTYGHDCGDKVLRNAADNMRGMMGEDSIPARIGGDEFLVVIRNKTQEEVSDILSKFTKYKKKIDYKGSEVSYTMSVGFAMYPQHGSNYNELYQNADLALYKVKMNGRNGFGVYNESLKSDKIRKKED